MKIFHWSKYFFCVLFFVTSVLDISCVKENKTSLKKNLIEDDLGNLIEFKKIPQKVISAAPNLTEILFKLELGNKIIGRTSYCNFPPEAESKEIVGDMLNLNFEKILELKPDLLLMTVEGNTKDSYDKLISLGVKVFVSNPRDLEGTNKTILDFGKIFNVDAVAENLIKNYNSRREKIINLSPGKNKKAMFIVSLTPLMLAGSRTFINEILATTGLINIAGESIVPYPFYNREEVINQNPDFIIIPSKNKIDRKYFLDEYKEWINLKAIKNNRIIVVEPDIFLRPGPRYIDAIEYLSAELKNFMSK